jgi:cytochrome c oxidase subunit I
MATPEYAAGTLEAPQAEISIRDFPVPRAGWIEWFTTTDHKKVGVLYLLTTTFFFVLGGLEALLMRIQLGSADSTFLDPTTYNQLFTLHGTTMIFLVVVPIFAGFASYLVPLMIGSRDVAFPRLNILSWWLLAFGGVVLYASIFFTVPSAGWTSYAPLSDESFLPDHGIDAWIISLSLVGLSSILVAINLIATIQNMRAPGMSLSRLPLFVWSMLAYSYLIIVVISSFLATLAMLLIDRNFDGTFFDSAQGGAPLLWQHLFWFMGHPELFVMLLPAFGILSEVIPVFARKPIFGYKAIAIATGAIALISLTAWGQHLFAAPLKIGVLTFFTLTALAVLVPISINLFNWLATLWKGNIELRVPLLFAVAVIAQFVVGVAGALLMAVFPVDWQLNDTFFAVATLHYLLVGGAVFGVLAGLYYWFPKMSGRMLANSLGKISFWITVIGFNVTFLPLHSAGLSGMPRRIVEYSFVEGVHGYNIVSTIGSFVLAVGILVTAVNVLWSLRAGRAAGPDPWRANTLEWFTTSPPPEHNFDVIPIVRSAEPMKEIRRRVARRAEPLPNGRGPRGAAPGERPPGQGVPEPLT